MGLGLRECALLTMDGYVSLCEEFSGASQGGARKATQADIDACFPV